MKCPFRKKTIYISGRNTGCGYPMEWNSVEEFEDCIGKECAAFYQKKIYSNTEGKYIFIEQCGVCTKKKSE